MIKKSLYGIYKPYVKKLSYYQKSELLIIINDCLNEIERIIQTNSFSIEEHEVCIKAYNELLKVYRCLRRY